MANKEFDKYVSKMQTRTGPQFDDFKTKLIKYLYDMTAKLKKALDAKK